MMAAQPVQLAPFVVVFDCDGVISNFTKAACEVVEDVSDRYDVYDYVRNNLAWDFLNDLELEPGEKKALYRGICAKGFCLNMQTMPDGLIMLEMAFEFCKLFEEHFIDYPVKSDESVIKIVTTPWASSRYWESERREWVKKHTQLKTKDVTFDHGKHIVAANVFVDDKPQNLFNARHSDVRLLMDRFHNRSTMLESAANIGDLEGKLPVLRLKDVEGMSVFDVFHECLVEAARRHLLEASQHVIDGAFLTSLANDFHTFTGVWEDRVLDFKLGSLAVERFY